MASVLLPTSVDELQRGMYLRAKLNPERRFQDIYDAIYREDVLQHAYMVCRARNTHAPGVDGRSLADIASYGARRWLKELAADLSTQQYRPSALLRVNVTKPDQPPHSKDIATLRDEVCMTAAMLIMEPLVAAWLIGKPEMNLSIDQKKLAETPGWSAYLATVSHADLTQRLASLITDSRVMNLFALWLASPITDGGSTTQQQDGVGAFSQGYGISNDLPISPLLTYFVAPEFLRLESNASISSEPKAAADNRNLPTASSPISHLDSPRRDSARTILRETQLGQALLLSLLFHAIMLAIQFGDPGSGLPLFGATGERQPTNIPVLTARLLPPAQIAVPPVSATEGIPERQKNSIAVKPLVPPTLNPANNGFTVAVVATNVQEPPTVESPTPHVKPPKKARPKMEVLSTKSASTWSRPVAEPAPETAEVSPVDQAIDTKAEDERIEKNRLAALEKIEAEKAQQAALAAAEKEALARQRAEDLARDETEKQQQALAAKAKADELAQAEAERQRQAAIASAKEAALAQQRAEELARIAEEKAKQVLEAKAAEARRIKKAQAEAEALASERAAKEEALARQRIDELARAEAEKQRLAAVKARQEELARIEAEKLRLAAIKAKQEEQARVELEKQRQAELARAKEEAEVRQRAEALAKIAAEKAKQEQEAKAAAEQLAKRVEAEAEALAKARAAEAVAQAKKIEAERALAAEQARAAQIAAAASAAAASASTAGAQSVGAANTAGLPGNGKGRDDAAAQTAGGGRDLVSRAPDAARNPSSSLLPLSPVETPSTRRASILGRDPKDIQLAFYGEGWRQKVERIGAMNFPKLSKFLVYDPVVVTVSINSDGSLAGVRIVKSSGHPDLDNAVRRIIEMSAPFSAFPPDMKRSFDVVDITRSMVFVGDRPQINRD